MLRLSEAVQAWGSAEFESVLLAQLEGLDAQALPLQQAVSQGSYVTDKPFRVMYINAGNQAGYLHAKVGIFFTSIIGGCQCADDPTPPDELNEYCELQIDIHLASGQARINLLPD